MVLIISNASFSVQHCLMNVPIYTNEISGDTVLSYMNEISGDTVLSYTNEISGDTVLSYTNEISGDTVLSYSTMTLYITQLLLKHTYSWATFQHTCFVALL